VIDNDEVYIISSEWMNSPSLLAILRLPFCRLERFSIIVRRFGYLCDNGWVWNWQPCDWNGFSSDLRDALTNVITSPTLKTLSITGVKNVPMTFFHRIVHLETLELHFLSPNDFGGRYLHSLTRAASKRVAPVIDRCLWRFREEDARASGLWSIELKFLPFMFPLRFLEIYIDLSTTTEFGIRVLDILMATLRNSLLAFPATLEHLEFNIRFRGDVSDLDSFYDTLRVAYAWSDLDFITTHPAGSWLQQVDINIYSAFRRKDDGAEPDKDEVSNAVLDSLPLLRTKGILSVRSRCEWPWDRLVI